MNKLAILLLTGTALALFSGAALAADLPMVSGPMTAAAPAPSGGWDGLYLGASAGYSWGTATANFNNNAEATVSGGFVGGQIGYNFHLSDNILLGVEGDLNWSDETGSFANINFNNNGEAKYRINWDGSVRGRLGYDAGQFLPYLEAGVAFANATTTFNDGTTESATHTGYTLGAGVEFKLADQLSANVEYRYSNYGTATYGSDKFSLTDNSVRIGLDYHLQ
jgi:outer membrane immunogenic protein